MVYTQNFTMVSGNKFYNLKPWLNSVYTTVWSGVIPVLTARQALGESRPPPVPQQWVISGIGRQFTVQNPDKLYVLVSSALPTTHHNMTCTVLKAMQNPK